LCNEYAFKKGENNLKQVFLGVGTERRGRVNGEPKGG
jgi:hypothetical protein